MENGHRILDMMMARGFSSEMERVTRKVEGDGFVTGFGSKKGKGDEIRWRFGRWLGDEKPRSKGLMEV